ncbi:MAG TPA: peptidylprolyl isomerase [Phycisphaerae bacterium]|nr:peptidylprolyl isomerase [Phycisphaerae bacterium]
MSVKLQPAMVAIMWFVVLSGCYVPSSSGPQRLDVNAGEDFTVALGEMAPLTVTVNGHSAGYAFRWSHESGPEQVPIADETSASTEAGPLNLEGDYKFRVIASTADGAFGQAFVIVTATETGSENGQDNANGEDNENQQANENGDTDTGDLIPPDRVRINAPTTVPAGQRGTLVATSPPLGFEAAYQWNVLAGSAEIREPTERETSITSDAPGTVEVEVIMTVQGIDQPFTDSATIEVLEENAFASNITGPSDAVVGEEVKLSASHLGVSIGGITNAEWQILSGDAEIVETQSGGSSIMLRPIGEGDVVLAMDASLIGAAVSQSHDEHLIVVYPAAGFELQAEQLEHLALVGQPVGVDVTAAEGNNQDLNFAWEFKSGEGSFDDPGSRTPNVTVTTLGTAELEVTATQVLDGRMRSGTLVTYVTTVNDLRPVVEIDVENFGVIPMQLNGDAAPITVANFLHYVDAPEFNYDFHVFNRVIPDFVVQGGGTWTDRETLEEVETRPPISGEANNGLSNLRGTVAMALRGSDPDSATQAFYINLSDDNAYLDEDFTVFGVVTGDGMQVADAISQVETDASDAPVEFVIMTTIRRTDTGDN